MKIITSSIVEKSNRNWIIYMQMIINPQKWDPKSNVWIQTLDTEQRAVCSYHCMCDISTQSQDSSWVKAQKQIVCVLYVHVY